RIPGSEWIRMGSNPKICTAITSQLSQFGNRSVLSQQEKFSRLPITIPPARLKHAVLIDKRFRSIEFRLVWEQLVNIRALLLWIGEVTNAGRQFRSCVHVFMPHG